MIGASGGTRHERSRAAPGPVLCPVLDAEVVATVTTAFASLRRADQRRWAEIYVRGLLAGTARASARHLARTVRAGRADQSLQQFVSHSPWDPQPVRRALAEQLGGPGAPAAWVAVEVPFVRNGRHSAGVDRQYVRGLGRVCNCQLGLALVLADGSRACPAEWRLMLPPAWDTDAARRARAHVPSTDRYQPCWRHVVDAYDTVTEWTGVPAAPVVCDVPVAADVATIAEEFEERCHRFVASVPGTLPVRRVGSAGSPPRALPGAAGALRPVPLAELVRATGGDDRRTVLWTEPGGRIARSQFVVVAASPARRTHPRSPQPDRHVVLAEWPHTYWLTNLVDLSSDELVAVTRARGVADRAVDDLHTRFGLAGYEGRSFLGWHHHVTLSSVAHAAAAAHTAHCGASCRGTG